MTLELTTFTVEIGTKTCTLESILGGQVARYRDDVIMLTVVLHQPPRREETLVRANAGILVAGTSIGEARRVLRRDEAAGRGEFLSDDNMRTLVQEAWADGLARYRHDFKHAEDRYRRFRDHDKKLAEIMGPSWGPV